MAARKWTDAQKAKQSLMISEWQPWQSSTGPKTSTGKAISSQNACKGRVRQMVRLSQWLNKNHGRSTTAEFTAKLQRLNGLIAELTK